MTMDKILFVISAILFSAVISVNSLKCYECENCNTVSDEHLVTCGETATTPSTTTVSGSTASGGSSTTSETTSTGGSTSTSGSSTTGGSTTPTPESSTSPGTEQSPATASTSTTNTAGTNAPVLTADNASGDEGNIETNMAADVQVKAPEYVCVTLRENGTVSRGCAWDETDGKICDQVVDTNITCTSCKTDNCNSAVSIQISTLLIFAAILFKYI